MKHGVGDLCYQGTFACFFSRKPMVMHFQIFDEVKQIKMFKDAIKLAEREPLLTFFLEYVAYANF